MPAVANTKVFAGKTYHLFALYDRVAAMAMASQLKSEGVPVRTVKTSKGYAIYIIRYQNRKPTKGRKRGK